MKAPGWFAILFSLCALNFPVQAADDVDLVLLNGNVYTVNEKQPLAEAIAVKNKRIVFVGSNADAKKFHAARTTDLAGKTVVPGLTDSHCHIFGIGDRELTLNLEGTNTLEDFLAKVGARATKTEPGKWITGRGWIETFWKPAQFPTREDLDKIAKENPVFLTRADGHAAVANSAALAIAKIDKNTPNPFGGEILKDKPTGEPTGMLLDNAMDLVEKQIPKPTAAEREQALITGINRELSLGWCEIQNAGSHKEDIDLIKKAYFDAKARIRFVNCVFGPGQDAQDFLNQGPIIDGFDHHFTQRTIKVIFDGALGSRGAALLKPYSDAPETSGYLTEKPEELRPMFEEALRRGIQPHDSRFVRGRIQSSTARPTKNRGAAMARRARADCRSCRSAAIRQARRDSVNATVACDQRFVFRAETIGIGSPRRGVCVARLFEKRFGHLWWVRCAG